MAQLTADSAVSVSRHYGVRLEQLFNAKHVACALSMRVSINLLER